MKVYGQLEAAQLEQIASTTTTPSSTGRIYADISNPQSAIPRFFNGTSWVPLLVGTPGNAPVSQNGGKACTVNWATGLFQQVVLTDNCTISFSNPVPGQTHRLLVVQAALNSSLFQYTYVFNLIDQDSRRLNYQPQYMPGVGNNTLHSWYYSPAIRAAYITVPQIVSLPNSGYIPAIGASVSVAIHPEMDAISVACANTPYGYTNRIIEKCGKVNFGLDLQHIAWAGVTTAFAYSAEGNVFFSASGTTPFIEARPTYGAFQRGFGSGMLDVDEWSNPATVPTGAAKCLAPHPLGNWIVVGHATTPFMSAYPYSSAGFGTKIANPATVPAAAVIGAAFNPTGDYLAVATGTTPFIQIYPWNIAAGYAATFGALVANPGTLPTAVSTAGGKVIAWRPQGDYVAMLLASAPYLYIVAFNRVTGSFGATVTVNYTAPAALQGIAWTPDGQYLVMGTSAAPYVVVLDFSAQTIGASAVALDSTGIGQQVTDVAIAPHGEWAALALAASPFVATIALPLKVRNYLRLIE